MCNAARLDVLQSVCFSLLSHWVVLARHGGVQVATCVTVVAAAGIWVGYGWHVQRPWLGMQAGGVCD